LQRLARAAEKSIREDYQPQEKINDTIRDYCNYDAIIRPFDVHNLTGLEDRQHESGVHINIESYKCDPAVVRDFTWTGSSDIEEAFKQNERADATIPNQFIGTYTSLTRMYPRRQWEIEPASITVDLFDPKFRPWFVNVEAAPKDIVFLLDYSGSTKGPTMHLSRITLLYILSTLTPNDYIAGVWFNSKFDRVLDCNQSNFIPATTRNKKIFYDKSAHDETEKADLGPPLKLSIDMLRNHSTALFGDSRSGAHKLIILMSDGIDEWPHSVIDTINQPGEAQIRVYGMAMGFGTGHLPLLEHLACISNATTSLVDSVADVKLQSRSYLNHLSSVHALTLQDVPIEKRPISWIMVFIFRTNLYMDNQAAGPVITLSTPVVAPLSDGNWNNSRMAGVAGVDVHIKELTEHLPHTDGLRAFIVDNNGIVVYHKDHRMPKTEVHAVRRSACYDPSHIKKKSGHGMRVQYGHSDERVYRLVGLLDSIPTIDLYDLESNSTIVQKLRRAIMTGGCDGTTKIYDDTEKSQDYYVCQSVAGTPLTIVILQSANVTSYEYAGPPVASEDITTSNPMVQYLTTKRSACNWAIDKIHDDYRTPVSLERLRYSEWINHQSCHSNPDEQFSRTMAKILKKWTEQWPLPRDNEKCENAIFPGVPFNQDYYLNSFVYTRGQIAAFYPIPDSEASMKELTEKMEKERLWRFSNDDIQFSVRGANETAHAIIYKAILDDKGNRLAVVGIQWKLQYLSDYFIAWMANHTYKTDPCVRHMCLLLSRSAYVIASN
ncbi:hypothetical protein PFISCL1PPCAC_8124, partial [Pristionchus fissidentatus]